MPININVRPQHDLAESGKAFVSRYRNTVSPFSPTPSPPSFRHDSFYSRNFGFKLDRSTRIINKYLTLKLSSLPSPLYTLLFAFYLLYIAPVTILTMERDDLKRLDILIVNFWVEEYIVLWRSIFESEVCALQIYFRTNGIN